MCIESQSMRSPRRRDASRPRAQTKRIVGNLGCTYCMEVRRFVDSRARARFRPGGNPERCIMIRGVLFANSDSHWRGRGRADATMATPSQSFEQLTVFGRFLRQKNGIANMLMAGLCVRARTSVPIPRARPDPEGTPREENRRAARTRTPLPASRAPLTFLSYPVLPNLSQLLRALGSPAAAAPGARRAHRGDGIGVRDGTRGAQRRDRPAEGTGVVRSGAIEGRRGATLEGRWCEKGR